MKDLEASVGSSLRKAGVPRGAGILVAVSGGPDSTALLLALASLQPRLGTALSACIVDHGIRPASAVEADLLSARLLCESLGIELSVARVPRGECRQRARTQRRSLEEVAREARHRLLRQAAGAVGAGFIALGHTQDDLVETILMRVLQGSGVRGLACMPILRGNLLRPLLDCTRRDVIHFLTSRGRSWTVDETNGDLSFLRNRVRHVLVPVLDRAFSGYRRGLLALGRKLEPVRDLVDSQASAIPWRPLGDGFAVSRQEFLASPPAARASSLLSLYDRMRTRRSPRRLPWRFVAAALGPRASLERGWILRGHGVGLYVGNGEVRWAPDIVRGGKKGYFIEVSETESRAIREIGLRVSLVRSHGRADVSTRGFPITSRSISPPLVLRSRRKGDQIILDGGSRSVKDLLAGWKVSPEDRDAVPVLADRRGVVAVLGSALGYASRARAGVLADEVDAERILVHICRDGEE